EDFLLRQWHWVICVANKAGNTRRVTDRSPGIFGHIHADQYVAWHTYAANHLAYGVFDLDDFFHRNFDFIDVIFDFEGLAPCFKVCFNATLIARVSVNHIPVTWSTA